MTLSNLEDQSSEVRKRLRELVEYVEELVRQGEKPIFALNEHKNVLYYESDLKGQIGVQHDIEDEDGPIWVKIERLKRIDPPVVPESIREWLVVSRDPFREPVVETMRVQTMHEAEAAKLVARGLVANDDVQPTLKTRSAERPRRCSHPTRTVRRHKHDCRAVRQWTVARMVRGRETPATYNCSLRCLL